MTKNILITGGAGYIGTACTNAFISAGHNVIVYDSLVSGQKEKVNDKATFIQGDILDDESLDEVFSLHSVDVVVHLAALKSVADGQTNPEEYYRVNVMGTLHLLEAMRKAQVKNIVFSSTAAVYQPNETGIYKEDDSIQASSVYGSTKVMCEELFRTYQSLGYLSQVTIFRYFNLAGDSGALFLDSNAQNVFPLLAQAIQKEKEFKIFGNNYETRDGTCIRDYIHIDDLVDAHIKAIAVNSSGTFNLGTEIGVTVQELVDAFEKISGKPLLTIEAERRDGDLPQAIADASQAKQQLDWHPSKTLEEMISSTLSLYT